jgi:formylglycine-generating enzyme required for sulfatase activity
MTRGNVWRWVEDCWHNKYDDAPRDGSAGTESDCSARSLRGGAWNDTASDLRAAVRSEDAPGGRFDDNGFLVARTLPP